MNQGMDHDTFFEEETPESLIKKKAPHLTSMEEVEMAEAKAKAKSKALAAAKEAAKKKSSSKTKSLIRLNFNFSEPDKPAETAGTQAAAAGSAKLTKKTQTTGRIDAATKKKKHAPQAKKSKLPALKITGVWAQVLMAAFFPLAFFYMEMIFHPTFSDRLLWRQVLLMFLFSCFPGGILYAAAAGIKRTWLRNTVVTLLMLVFTLPFIVEYYVLKSFKVLYDLKTVLNGAGGVARGFMSDVVKLVFSPSGLLYLFLFLLPTILYWAFFRKLFETADLKKHLKKAVLALAGGVGILLITILGVSFSSLASLHGSKYVFSRAVENFGLLDGVRMEISHLGKSETLTFAEENALYGNGAHLSTWSLIEKLTSSESIQARNQMDIDFEELLDDSTINWDSDIVSALQYLNAQESTNQNDYTGLFEGKNLIMICAEAFSGALIDEERTPTLYRLANQGIQFTNFYQPAISGTTGGEVQFLLGLMPVNGGESMYDVVVDHDYFLTMGAALNRQGYYGQAFHPNDYTFYDRNITHNCLGYSEGFMGYGNGMEAYVTEQWPQSDREMIDGTLPLYIDEESFNIYYMTVSGHSQYDKDANAMAFKNWSAVENLDYSDLVKGYLAANMELEYALEDLVAALEEKGIADDTVIVLCPDHFPYGLDENAILSGRVHTIELYGYDIKNVYDRDKNSLIIWSGSLEDEEPIVVDDPVCAMDVLPTLLNLFGCEFDSRLLPGRDVFSNSTAMVWDSYGNWMTEYGYYLAEKETFYLSDENQKVTQRYIETMDTIVWNKIYYCKAVMDTRLMDILANELNMTAEVD